MEHSKQLKLTPEQDRWLNIFSAAVLALVEALMAIPTQRAVAHVINILFSTGLRTGEIAALKYVDLDLDKNVIQVASSKSVTRGNMIPLTPAIVQAMQALHALHPESEFILGKSPNNILAKASKQMQLHADGLGLGPAHLYMLRRAYVFNLVRSRVGLQTIAKLARTGKTFIIDGHLVREVGLKKKGLKK